MNLKFEEKNILVIGDLMIDHYIHGNCVRISPEAPVPVVEIKTESYSLGGAGNVLKNLISLGSKSSIISVMGNDDNADIVINKLNAIQVAGDGIVRDSSRCTTIKSRVLATNHQLIRLDREQLQPISNQIEQQVLSLLESCINNFDVVLISDYNKGLLTSTLLKEIFEISRKNNVLTIVDPKGADFTKYKGANVIKPNKKEAIQATGITITDEQSLNDVFEKLQDITGCEHVIITMSEEGIGFYSENTLSLIPTKALDVVDVTGAGDTVLAALGVALAAGNTLKDASDFANHAAAVVVNKVGSATVTLDEVLEKYNKIVLG